MNNKKTTRKGSTPIKVYCLPEEKQQIEANAKMAGLSAACYLREVGQGYHVRSVVDFNQVRELVRINGDLGRLGGLLKVWLSDDVRLARYGEDVIWALLGRIEKTQDDMRQIMQSVLRPRAES